jgi:hypothetical protein
MEFWLKNEENVFIAVGLIPIFRMVQNSQNFLLTKRKLNGNIMTLSERQECGSVGTGRRARLRIL